MFVCLKLSAINSSWNNKNWRLKWYIDWLFWIYSMFQYVLAVICTTFVHKAIHHRLHWNNQTVKQIVFVSTQAQAYTHHINIIRLKLHKSKPYAFISDFRYSMSHSIRINCSTITAAISKIRPAYYHFIIISGLFKCLAIELLWCQFINTKWEHIEFKLNDEEDWTIRNKYWI